MARLGPAPPLLALLLFIQGIPTAKTKKIQCFSCTAPKNTVHFEKYCSEDKFCRGAYCFKGPDETSSGIVHGCVDTPPIDSKKGSCKLYYGSEIKENCYCKNVEFCNITPKKIGFLWLMITVMFVF